MKIYNIKINGIRNPVGFDFCTLNVSYLTDYEPKTSLFVQISKTESFEKILWEQEIDFEKSFCSPLDFTPEKETRYFLRIVSGETVSEKAFFETGTDFDCRFISPCDEISHPVLFKDFSLKENISSARLYVTGLGLYEAYINDKKAGNEYLTPNCNDYDEYVQYQTYDVTDLLKKENRLEIMLGNGWYKGRFGLKHRENIFGTEYMAAAKLVVTYTGGGKEIISTDESWSARSSFVVSGNIYDGEIVDRTRDITKISSVKYANKTWNVIPRVSLPIVVKSQIKPIVYVSPKKEQILDFGQNFSGFVSFNCKLAKGQTVRLQAGEVLQNDCFYRENLRSAKAEFVYTSDGEQRTVRPQFTFYGFRYIFVEGIERVNAEDFVGNVLYSDLDDTVSISTDNEKINRLLQNCIWGQRSNFVDVPTDCPQRDERLGWTGDAEVFSKTACYQMDCRAFYDKYLKDVATDQKNYGTVTTYSPAMKEGELAYSVWGDAATIIPWNVYTVYGDKTLLAKHFPMMERYVETLLAKDNENGGQRLYNFGFHLGDWLSQDGATPSAMKGATDEYFIASLYYYNSVKIASESAKILGLTEKQKRYDVLKEEIRQAILREYFTGSGKLAVDTQTAYVLCVAFDVYRDKERLVKDFAARLKKDSYKIKGGFVGATQFIQALISCGLTEEAFRVLYCEQYPSWLYCVNLGATTIWERWNSINADGRISGTGMNSLNHYSFGSVAEAFYAYIAGVRPVAPAFKKATIAPKFNYRLKKLDFEFTSASGVYAVKYQVKEGNRLDLFVKVPYGATATLIIDGQTDKELKGGEYRFEILSPVELNNPYSANSAICDLLANTETSAILKKNVPILYHFLSTSDIGINGETLKHVTSLQSFFVAPERVAQIDKQLKEIKQ